MIPKYFFSLFESVQRIEDYLNIKFDDLGLDPQDIQSLHELSKEILIVTPRGKNDFNIKSACVEKENHQEDLDINQVRFVAPLFFSFADVVIVYTLD